MALPQASEGTLRFEFGIHAHSKPGYAEQHKTGAHGQHDTDDGNEVCDFRNRNHFPQDQRKNEPNAGDPDQVQQFRQK